VIGSGMDWGPFWWEAWTDGLSGDGGGGGGNPFMF
jgi:hypothetical protein